MFLVDYSLFIERSNVLLNIEITATRPFAYVLVRACVLLFHGQGQKQYFFILR